jgi:hypothetical protein
MLAAGPTRADDLTFYVEALAGGRVGSTFRIDWSGQVQIPPATAGPVIIDTGSGLGSSSSAAGFGSLTAFAAASSVDGILALGSADATWSDTLIATSTDPSVTQITFLATITLSDSISASDNVQGSAQAALLLLDETHGVGDPPIVGLQDTTSHPLIDRTATVTFTERVGVPFRLFGVLSVGAEAGQPFEGEGVIIVDASDGATFYLDPITPEGGYTTASGFSYLIP